MCFLHLWKENEAAKTQQTRQILETAVISYSVKYPSLPPGVGGISRLCRSLVIMV